MKYILCQPAIKRFKWELEVCVARLHKLGVEDIILLFAQEDDSIPKYFEDMDCEVHVYHDNRANKSYIPSIKPYLWMRFLEEDPSREKETYFYLDSDVLFREIPDVNPTEDTWYASKCASYISVDYIDSKENNLLEDMCNAIGIDTRLIRKHQPAGGAQWAIKNPNYDYWKKVYQDSITLYKLLDRSDTDIQKWTAEMWAQLWNVYHFGIDVETPKEMDFSWPTDKREEYYNKKIFHNAGVVDDNQNLFFKGKYVNHTPFKDDFAHVNQGKASYEYVLAIKEVINMAKYEVIAGFKDKETKKDYFVGDRYPKPANKKVEQERLDELASSDNAAGHPLIQKVDDE
ncbi:hypothetical protein [Paraliobacillus ryukyuensis]|uniref:hypothetical protein n=1 Tax=Paraliobacillus ryukyuensis TaxID=200904 RepID=UPI0009A74D59|nr:hypothetical protein [Paraliobacillus ryukyuensis]